MSYYGNPPMNSGMYGNQGGYAQPGYGQPMGYQQPPQQNPLQETFFRVVSSKIQQFAHMRGLAQHLNIIGGIFEQTKFKIYGYAQQYIQPDGNIPQQALDGILNEWFNMEVGPYIQQLQMQQQQQMQLQNQPIIRQSPLVSSNSQINVIREQAMRRDMGNQPQPVVEEPKPVMTEVKPTKVVAVNYTEEDTRNVDTRYHHLNIRSHVDNLEVFKKTDVRQINGIDDNLITAFKCDIVNTKRNDNKTSYLQIDFQVPRVDDFAAYTDVKAMLSKHTRESDSYIACISYPQLDIIPNVGNYHDTLLKQQEFLTEIYEKLEIISTMDYSEFRLSIGQIIRRVMKEKDLPMTLQKFYQKKLNKLLIKYIRASWIMDNNPYRLIPFKELESFETVLRALEDRLDLTDEIKDHLKNTTMQAFCEVFSGYTTPELEKDMSYLTPYKHPLMNWYLKNEKGEVVPIDAIRDDSATEEYLDSQTEEIKYDQLPMNGPLCEMFTDYDNYAKFIIEQGKNCAYHISSKQALFIHTQIPEFVKSMFGAKYRGQSWKVASPFAVVASDLITNGKVINSYLYDENFEEYDSYVLSRIFSGSCLFTKKFA